MHSRDLRRRTFHPELIDIYQAKCQLEDIAALPREQRRVSLEKLSKEMNAMVISVGSCETSTIDSVRRAKEIAMEVHSALVRSRKK